MRRVYQESYVVYTPLSIGPMKKILYISALPPVYHEHLLTQAGYEVIRAHSVRQGRDLAQREHYDLILLVVQDGGDAEHLFCEDMKRVSPRTLIALISSSPLIHAASTCADRILEQDFRPQYFVGQVSAMFSAQDSAASQ